MTAMPQCMKAATKECAMDKDRFTMAMFNQICLDAKFECPPYYMAERTPAYRIAKASFELAIKQNAELKNDAPR